MSAIDLKPFTKVKITIDNTRFTSTSMVWQPSSLVLIGIVQHPNVWDEVNTLRLACHDQPTKFPVIPINIIQKIETNFTDSAAGDIENFQPPKEKSMESVFMVESSKADTFYRVTKNEDRWMCNCFAGLRQKKCRHIIEAQLKYKSDNDS